jgi:hypothetical protein
MNVGWRLVVLAVLATVAVMLVPADPNTLCVLPALLLAVPLLLRRYPGERLLTAVRRVRRLRRAKLPSPTPRTRPVATVVPRGGLLIASSLAVRPPPLLSSTS